MTLVDTITNWWKALFEQKAAPLPEDVEPGLHHYMKDADGRFHRFHLRIEPDGSGMLIADATAAARLHTTGVLMVKKLLEGVSDEEILADIRSRYRVDDPGRVAKDLEKLHELIDGLTSPDDRTPVTNFEGGDISSPYQARLFAPLKADIPACEGGLAVALMDRLWEIGIPHVTIHVTGEPDGESLVRAVERAEDTGMIAGIRGRATDLDDEALLKDLAMAGIDYVTVPCASAETGIHDGLLGEGDHEAVDRVVEAVRELEVCPVVDIPLTRETFVELDDTVAHLLEREVGTIYCFALATDAEKPGGACEQAFQADELAQVAARVEELGDRGRFRLLWQPPLLCRSDVSVQDQIRRGPRCTGDVSIRVEEDGDVVPARGDWKPAGNLLKDEWETIWNAGPFRIFRERLEQPLQCPVCPGLAICATACPTKPESWARGGPEVSSEQKVDEPADEADTTESSKVESEATEEGATETEEPKSEEEEEEGLASAPEETESEAPDETSASDEEADDEEAAEETESETSDETSASNEETDDEEASGDDGEDEPDEASKERDSE